MADLKDVKETSVKKSSAEMVEELLVTAKEELSTSAQKAMVNRLKDKLVDLKAAKKIVHNIEREIDEMKLELQQDIESITNV